jgi:hypothetical protein
MREKFNVNNGLQSMGRNRVMRKGISRKTGKKVDKSPGEMY